MRILILGAGKMGSFFTDLLSFDQTGGGDAHEVAVYEPVAEKLRFTYHCLRLTALREIDTFCPDLVLNCVTLRATRTAFDDVLPHIPAACILSDIASVKTGLEEYYSRCGHRYVSTHPMFGPTFANLSQLATENAIIISQGDEQGKAFFHDLYTRLGLNIYYYSFSSHDATVAYSLSIPFISTFTFAAVMRDIDAPGTTFKRHLAIARGVLAEDDYLLQEILFNPHTSPQVARIRAELKTLIEIIDTRDEQRMHAYIEKIRAHVRAVAG